MSTLVFLTVAAFFTAAISAVAGVGGGVVLISIISLFLVREIAVPIHGIVQLASNTTRTVKLRQHMVKKIVLPSLIGLPIGTLVAVKIIRSVENKEIFLFAIAILIFYTLFKPKKIPPLNIPYWSFSILGFCIGLLGPLVGATGPFSAPFYLRDDLKKEEVIASKAAVQTAGHLLKIPAFLSLNFDYLAHKELILLMILGVVAGTHYGIKLLKGINEKSFWLIFRTALFFAGCRVAYKAIVSVL